jgi:hypothetical protein
MQFYDLLICVVLLHSVTCFIGYWKSIRHDNRKILPSLSMNSGAEDSSSSISPVTYIPVELQAPKAKIRSTVLVKKGATDIIEILNSWDSKDKVVESMIEDWAQEGMAFWATPQGTRSMHIAERKREAVKQHVVKPSYSSNTYVQIGSEKEPVYVKSSRIADLESLDHKARTLQDMVRRGEAFTSVSKLMNEETMLNKVDGIATTLHQNFSMLSPEWKRWIDKTAVYNATSLQQVFAEYYRDHSIGDVGSKTGDYVPKRGFPGTLAPGEKFIDNYPIDHLSKEVLHPWPAMQEFQWHVRWPTSHPHIVPPLLWLGLNDMYTSNFTKWQLDGFEPDENTGVVGGTMMNPRDAMYIARYHNAGNSYEPSDQLKHGGNLFDGGFDIPHYTPDHGPTVSQEEAEPDVPEELVPITTRWIDPHFGLDIAVAKAEGEAGLIEEQDEEEERRQKLAKEMYGDSEEAEEVPDMLLEEDKTTAKLKKDLTKLFQDRHRAILPPPGEIDVGPTGSAEAVAETKTRVGREEHYVDEIIQAFGGRARSKKGLITYNIATVRDLKTEVDRVEKNTFSTKKRMGGRKKKKVANTEEE